MVSRLLLLLRLRLRLIRRAWASSSCDAVLDRSSSASKEDDCDRAERLDAWDRRDSRRGAGGRAGSLCGCRSLSRGAIVAQPRRSSGSRLMTALAAGTDRAAATGSADRCLSDVTAGSWAPPAPGPLTAGTGMAGAPLSLVRFQAAKKMDVFCRTSKGRVEIDPEPKEVEFHQTACYTSCASESLSMVSPSLGPVSRCRVMTRASLRASFACPQCPVASCNLQEMGGWRNPIPSGGQGPSYVPWDVNGAR